MSSPYTVLIDGVPVQCDTPEAALALAKAHAGGGTPHPKGGHRHEPNGTRWTATRVAGFYKLLEGKVKQTKLLDALLETDDARADYELVQILNLGSGTELAGVFAGLFKNAKKAGADPRELYAKKAVTIGDKRGFEYTLHDGFRAAVGLHRPKK